MKSSTATEMRLKAAVENMDRRIERMETLLTDQMKMLADMTAREELKNKFISGMKINHFEWTYERIFKSRKCFVSDKSIRFGTKAYKGINELSPLMPPEDITDAIYPQVVWLSKEEFTVRRLKGQI